VLQSGRGKSDGYHSLMKGSEPLDGISTVLGHDLTEDRVSPRLPGESLVVVMQRDTVTIRESGETDAWITSDCMVEL